MFFDDDETLTAYSRNALKVSEVYLNKDTVLVNEGPGWI